MTAFGLIDACCFFLCILVLGFFLFYILGYRHWPRPFDPENELAHTIMASGMLFMLAPSGMVIPALFVWNSILFAATSLWFIGRLLMQKPLLSLVFHTRQKHLAFQDNFIHILNTSGMSYMFLLMSSMPLSMTRPAMVGNFFFCFVFLFLVVLYGGKVIKDIQKTPLNRLNFGANLAHLLMNGIMSWMFFEMISMTLAMGRP